MKKKSKLILDKNTKELEIKEQNNLKKWLLENKIYFETIMTISLTIMGIIVSVISLSVDKIVADTQKEQLELERLSFMPIFNVDSTRHQEEYIIDGIKYDPCIEYEIVNNGGNIHNGYLRTEGRIEITINNVVIVLENSQRFLKSYSYYDANKKSFTVKRGYDNRNNELTYYLYDKFKEQNINIRILAIDYINIQYKDLEQNFHNEWYELNGDELLFRQPERGNYQTFLEINTMENEEVYNVLLNILNEINQSN